MEGESGGQPNKIADLVSDPGWRIQAEAMMGKTGAAIRFKELQSKNEDVFREKYGDLADLALNYNKRMDIMRRRYKKREKLPSPTQEEDEIRGAKEARKLYSTALVAKLNEQSTETRVQWLTGFLEDLALVSIPG